MTTTHDISARLRSLADTMQTLANDMAAVGMGRGEWPEHSLELHNAGTMARAWAVAIEITRKPDQDASAAAKAPADHPPDTSTLLKIDKAIEAGTFGKAETPGQSIWATALDGIEDATLPAARRRTKGKLARTTARYPQNDSDDDSDDDAPAFETGFNFQDLAEAEDAEDGG